VLGMRLGCKHAGPPSVQITAALSRPKVLEFAVRKGSSAGRGNLSRVHASILDNRACPCASPARKKARFMHRYRTHNCGALRETAIGKQVRLSGWCHRIRDHGGLLFIDLRDHYGITQVVADPDSPSFKGAEKLRSEWVVRIDGKVRKRPAGTENPDLPTG